MSHLSGRDRDIVKALVERWEASGREPFDMPLGEDTIVDDEWPAEIPRPRYDEVRSLVAREYLDIDKSVAPTWRFGGGGASRG